MFISNVDHEKVQVFLQKIKYCTQKIFADGVRNLGQVQLGQVVFELGLVGSGGIRLREGRLGTFLVSKPYFAGNLTKNREHINL